MNSFLRQNAKLLINQIKRNNCTRCHYLLRSTYPVCTNLKLHCVKDNSGVLLARYTSSNTNQDPITSSQLDLVTFETVCSDTLEALCEYFDDLVEGTPHLQSADVGFSVCDFILFLIYQMFFMCYLCFIYRMVF